MEKLLVTFKIMLKSSQGPGNYGPGIDKLIREVGKTGSLNKASKAMDMSYSKAWKLVNKTEEMLGFEIIERHPGAKGSKLTEDGEKLLTYYESLETKVAKAVEEVKKDFNF